MGQIVRRLVTETVFLAAVLVGLVAFTTVQQRAVTGSGHPAFGTLLQTNLQQYAQAVRDGDLGFSERYRKSVGVLVRDGATYTFGLMGLGLLLAIVLGTAKGVYDARRLHRQRFSLSAFLTPLFQGVPDFWLIMVLQWGVILSVRALGWRPFVIYFESAHPINSLLLPLLVVTLIPLGIVARVVTQDLQQILFTDYIRTARAKGLGEWRVTVRHALRPSLIGLLDALPGIAGVMLSNLAVAEYLTGLPGLLGLLLRSIWDPKAGLLLPTDGKLLITSGMLVAVTVLLLYEGLRLLRGLLDPRLRGVGH